MIKKAKEDQLKKTEEENQIDKIKNIEVKDLITEKNKI